MYVCQNQCLLCARKPSGLVAATMYAACNVSKYTGRVPNTHAHASHRIVARHHRFPKHLQRTSDTPSLVPVTALLSISLAPTALSVVYPRRGRLDDLPCSSVARASSPRSGCRDDRQSCIQTIGNSTLLIGNLYFLLPRTLLFSAKASMSWENNLRRACHAKKKATSASIEQPCGFHEQNRISSVDDHSNPSHWPHPFVKAACAGSCFCCNLRQIWRTLSSAPVSRYLSNRIFRLHTAYPMSLGCVARRSPGS